MKKKKVLTTKQKAFLNTFSKNKQLVKNFYLTGGTALVAYYLPYRLSVDSIIDIAVNKLFTIYQKARSRDFMDLYLIIKKYDYKIEQLIKKAKLKFDWHVDPLKLGVQFFKAKDLKDYPKLLEKIDHDKWQEFFKKEAKKLEEKILE